MLFVICAKSRLMKDGRANTDFRGGLDNAALS
jgi:hypothetical protein